MILDTTFLIDVMDREPAAVEKLQVLVAKGTPLTVTALSIFELFSGLEQSGIPEREQDKIQYVLAQQSRWGLDETSAERAGRIHGELIVKGSRIGAVDAMIAGIALQHQEPVLTRNVKDFSRIRGLNVETY